jgi:tetratricopeptide (TPR) repeat protein/transcriptional regulator with XRE-family HTH domain
MPSQRPTDPNAALRQARQLRGWSQEYVAERVGTNGFTVSRWELGQAFPHPTFRRRLADLFGQSPEALGLLPPGARSRVRSPAFAPRSAGGDMHVVDDPLLPPLPSLATGLIGRASLLQQLKARLIAGETLVLSALHGLPGVGKTALALALAYDQEVRAYFADGLLWTGLGQRPRLQETLARWGALLGLSPTDSRLSTPLAWAQALRSAIGTRRLLIILDDAWRLEDVVAFQVGGEHCAYLVTTRRPDLAVHVAGAGLAAVPELGETDGLTLLARLAPQVVADEPEAARALVQAVGGLPLGLLLMGIYLRREAHSGQPRRIRAALERLRQGTGRLHLAQPQAPLETHPSLPMGTPLSLQASIGLSVSALPQEAQTMLAALALFPPKPNSFSEAMALAVSAGTANTLAMLVERGLVEQVGKGRYTLHQTIVDYAQGQGCPEEAWVRLVECMVALVERQPRAYAALDLEASNVITALEAAFSQEMQEELVCGVLAWWPFLDARGWYDLAEAHLRRAERVARTGGDQRSLGSLLLHLGQVHRQRANYAQADSCFEEALALARAQGNPEQVCAALAARGGLAQKQGAYDQAETFLEEGLAVAHQTGHQEPLPDLLNTLGTVALQRGAYAQAERLLEEGLALSRHLDQDQLSAVLLQNLGICYRKQGNHAQAERCYQEAWALAEHLGHRVRLSSLAINLGALAVIRGDTRQAEVYLLEGVAMARALGQREHLAFLLANLGEVADTNGNQEQARAYLEEGLAVAREIGQREILSVLLLNLGTVQRKLGQVGEASECLEEGLEVARALNHSFLIAACLTEMGFLRLQQGQVEPAAVVLQQALELMQQAGHQEGIARAQFGLAQVAAARGELAEAASLGGASVRVFDAMGHRQAQEVRQWLSELEQGSVAAAPQQAEKRV